MPYSVSFLAILGNNFANHLSRVLKRWKNLKADFPDWHLTIMGNGEVERFQAMAHNMGLDDSVTFTGYITGKQKEDGG